MAPTVPRLRSDTAMCWEALLETLRVGLLTVLLHTRSRNPEGKGLAFLTRLLGFLGFFGSCCTAEGAVGAGSGDGSSGKRTPHSYGACLEQGFLFLQTAAARRHLATFGVIPAGPRAQSGPHLTPPKEEIRQ